MNETERQLINSMSNNHYEHTSLYKTKFFRSVQSRACAFSRVLFDDRRTKKKD